MLLPDIIHAKIIDHEGERDGTGRFFPEARAFLVGAYPWGARTDVSFVWARTPAWGRPYIPFRISKKTQGLWKKSTCPIAFDLVVDDFGVNYVREEHANHLLDILLANYEGVHEDWGGTKICGITLKWDYIQCTCKLSMPGYIEATLNRFHQPCPNKPELATHRYASRSFSAANAQAPIPDKDTARLDTSGVLRVELVVGCILLRDI